MYYSIFQYISTVKPHPIPTNPDPNPMFSKCFQNGSLLSLKCTIKPLKTTLKYNAKGKRYFPQLQVMFINQIKYIKQCIIVKKSCKSHKT